MQLWSWGSLWGRIWLCRYHHLLWASTGIVHRVNTVWISLCRHPVPDINILNPIHCISSLDAHQPRLLKPASDDGAGPTVLRMLRGSACYKDSWHKAALGVSWCNLFLPISSQEMAWLHTRVQVAILHPPTCFQCTSLYCLCNIPSLWVISSWFPICWLYPSNTEEEGRRWRMRGRQSWQLKAIFSSWETGTRERDLISLPPPSLCSMLIV